MERSLVNTAIRVVWHLFRYTLATCISTAASAVLPVLVGSAPIAVAIGWILAWGAALLFFVLTGESIGIEIGEPVGIVIVPALLMAFGTASVSAALSLAAAFSVVAVLPVSLLTEFACWRLSFRAIILRLVSFLVAGLFLGVAVGGITVALAAYHQIQAPPLALLGLAMVLSLISVCAVFTSGLVLTTMSFVKDKLVALEERARAVRRSNTRG